MLCIPYIIDGLVQDCSNSIANALELLQSCTKPSTCFSDQFFHTHTTKHSLIIKHGYDKYMK